MIIIMIRNKVKIIMMVTIIYKEFQIIHRIKQVIYPRNKMKIKYMKVINCKIKHTIIVPNLIRSMAIPLVHLLIRRKINKIKIKI